MIGVRKKHRFDPLMCRNIVDINKRSKIKCSLLCRDRHYDIRALTSGDIMYTDKEWHLVTEV